MRYGTLPVVRNTGGLRDTVVDATDDALSGETATGFVFEGATGNDMVHCVGRAVALYQQPMAWRKLQRQAMAQDFSWAGPARRYLALYHSLVPQDHSLVPQAVATSAVTADPVLKQAAG
jgi:starch synthase